MATLGAANGFCIGLLCALVGGITQSNWTYDDTKNMLSTGTVVGAYLGAFVPV